ncbi:hypothetical protein JNUCC0626_18085 [Lentzea sp. JNUCC 0626]|uniref:hypothetical protein n=1 Tax=Lentzea sp. JNUCC 0626 TaxID=3367513 RepID=UPI003749D51B
MRSPQRKDVPVELVLAYARDWKAGGADGLVHRLVQHGFPTKVALAKVNQLIGLRLLECGTTAFYSWPTDEGLALLHTLEGGAA